MINDERWHGPFFREKSGSFKNNAKYAIFRDFLGFFIFCKKRRHTIEKLMSFLESPVFFWSPCKISCLGKVWFIQKWPLIDPDWRVFLRFLTILNEPILKKYMCDQNDFLDTERDTWGLLTLKISSTELHYFIIFGCLGFCKFLNDPKWI